MYAHEKQGGLLRSENQMMVFRDVIEDCGLTELEHSGTNLHGVIEDLMIPLFLKDWIVFLGAVIGI